jgi:hypothetical protein
LCKQNTKNSLQSCLANPLKCMRCSQSVVADRSGETGHRGNKLQLIPVHLLSHHRHNGAGVVLLTTFWVKNYSTAARLCQPSTTEECSSPQARCPIAVQQHRLNPPLPFSCSFCIFSHDRCLLPFVYEVTIIIPGNTRLDPNSIQFSTGQSTLVRLVLVRP